MDGSTTATESPFRRRLIPILALCIILLGALVLIPRLVTRFKPNVSPRPGYAPPDFSLQSLDGQTISLSAQKGKPVVLVFVASWCEVCREEMPMMVEAFRAHRIHAVVFLGVDSFEDRAHVQRFREEFQIPFPLLLDADGAVASRFEVKGTPTNLFIDRSGMVRDLVIGGPLSRAYLDKEIAPLLETALQ